MKRYVLLSLLAVAGFLSCGKDDDKKDNVNVGNPDAVTAAAKVYYGTTVQGQLPAVTAGAPVVELYTGDDAAFALAGGFIVLEPSSTAGEAVKGYLVQINGAKSYFKIDYSQTRGARRAPGTGLFKEQGASDSLIVVKLPEDITSGELCVNVAAYNDAGQIGNVVKHCITIIRTANETTLSGTWNRSRSYDKEKNKWSDRYDSSRAELMCSINKLGWLCEPGLNCTPVNVLTDLKIDSSYMTFNANGSFVYVEKRTLLNINLETSSCSAFKYNTSVVEEDPSNAFWAYDKASKRLILTDNTADDNGASFESYQLEIDGKKFVITFENGDKEEYTKK